MLGFVIQFDQQSDQPKYIQLYEHIKDEVHTGQLVEGEKLPSIRSVSEALGVSKSTVEGAYAQLVVEGYIESRPKSGYYVLRMERFPMLTVKESVRPYTYCPEGTQQPRAEDASRIRRFAATDGVEPHLFNFNAWRKMLTKVMDYEQDELIHYGDRQGEYSLRAAIAKFVHEMRGVVCTPDQIIVGAGVQTLFMLLSALLKPERPAIAFEYPGFLKGATIFEDYGYETVKIPVKAQGINIEALAKSSARVVYVSPAHQYPTGSIMPINNRMKLLKWASENDAYIIEDDYDSVLRYEGVPIPSLQGLNRGKQVVHVGAFSKLLMPSLRISFMILPEDLLTKYVKIKTRYSQTVSKVEQLTLAHFMREGYFDRHIRKIKKAYAKKNQLILEALKMKGSDLFHVIGKTSGLHVVLSFDPVIDVTTAAKKMQAIGIRLEDAGLFEGRKIAVLSYSGLPDDAIDEAVAEICGAIRRQRLEVT
ncbi:PLP-dependent aminotransferase family protein [Fusibacter paucivorans]|uniref:PLP-dependent aminotransferase family protein n=1 Tax=Fusibacter paucivorans TaxID=76009 RepID=A0ABS5PMY8_9FIRM|nr:PLP-dependent aminotransferase family protein [Fusibacter paucivorans]MBS7526428.1 PLP-dependent aminotransferase family protein [Fusibacter paucivorans]